MVDLRSSPTNSKCLGCGYDLRAAMREGAGSVVCPECGRKNDLWTLRQQGASLGAVMRLAAVIVAPALLLVGSAWGFGAWSGQSVHAWLCIMMAPAVIIVHAYAMWIYVQMRFILPRSTQRRLAFGAVALAVIIDVASCAAVIVWLV
ncbi:MAG: hypothetical protein L0Y44_08125 [Phycisphaerales bacterium]|nr:hypothetical protein [Phycisphaerales bacterium]MCI0630602.1 hypothetical protein [Phycisphaerales bacterium]MCI0676839.1 hypothetical protein [Phycisphaerales bacterium]